MNKFQEQIFSPGSYFHNVNVTSFHGIHKKELHFRCKCTCGAIVIISAGDLFSKKYICKHNTPDSVYKIDTNKPATKENAGIIVQVPKTEPILVWGHHAYQFMGTDGLSKLGRTGNIPLRLKQVQANNGGPLTLAGSWPELGYLEADVHRELKLRGHHLHNEWYDQGVTPELVGEIIKMVRLTH